MKTHYTYKFIVLSFIFSFAIGCSNSSQDIATNNKEMVKNEINTPLKNNLQNDKDLSIQVEKINKNIPQNRKIIWHAEMCFQVKQVNKATQNIVKMVNNAGGFIANMDMTNSDYEISNKLTIRIKSDDFNSLLINLKKEAIFVDNVSITSNDVTEQFIDIESRLNTKRDVRNRYIEILKNKAKKVEDILNAEEKIRIITEEIEALEGRLRYLTDKVDYSTITANIYQKVECKETPKTYHKPYIEDIKNAFSNGWDIVKTMFVVIINIWPLLIIGIAIWFYIKRKKHKKTLNK